jgi:hypothetical protein
MILKRTTYFSRLFFAFCATATICGCDSSVSGKGDAGNAQGDMKSLGGKENDIFMFNLSYKVVGSKLFWGLESMQKIRGIAGLGGESGPRADELATKIFDELETKAGADFENTILIDFIDKNGFTVVKTTTQEMSKVTLDGQQRDPSTRGWLYRGVINIDEAESSRIEGYQLTFDFSDKLLTIASEASEFLEQKKAARAKAQ